MRRHKLRKVETIWIEERRDEKPSDGMRWDEMRSNERRKHGMRCGERWDEMRRGEKEISKKTTTAREVKRKTMPRAKTCRMTDMFTKNVSVSAKRLSHPFFAHSVSKNLGFVCSILPPVAILATCSIWGDSPPFFFWETISRATLPSALVCTRRRGLARKRTLGILKWELIWGMNWSTPKWMVYKGTSHEKFMIWGYHFCWVLFPHIAMCSFFVFFLLHPAAASSASTTSSSAAAPSTSHHQQHHLTISTSSTHNASTPSSHSPSTRHHQLNTPSWTQNIISLTINTTSWTSGSFCVAGAALGAPPARLLLRGRGSTWSTSGSFCVARAAFGAPSTQHHLHNIIRHSMINTTPSPQHHQHNVINTTSATHYHLHNTIYTIPSTQHHPDNTIYTTSSNTPSSTQPHPHITISTNTIYTTPSTLHHQHNTIYTTSSNIGRCSSWSTAILPLLPHSCWFPFLFVDCSLFCFVDLFHSWMSEDIVNMWRYPVL